MKIITAVTNPGTTVAISDIVPPDPETGLPSDSSRAEDAQPDVDECPDLDDTHREDV